MGAGSTGAGQWVRSGSVSGACAPQADRIERVGSSATGDRVLASQNDAGLGRRQVSHASTSTPALDLLHPAGQERVRLIAVEHAMVDGERHVAGRTSTTSFPAPLPRHRPPSSLPTPRMADCGCGMTIGAATRLPLTPWIEIEKVPCRTSFGLSAPSRARWIRSCNRSAFYCLLIATAGWICAARSAGSQHPATPTTTGARARRRRAHRDRLPAELRRRHRRAQHPRRDVAARLYAPRRQLRRRARGDRRRDPHPRHAGARRRRGRGSRVAGRRIRRPPGYGRGRSGRAPPGGPASRRRFGRQPGIRRGWRRSSRAACPDTAPARRRSDGSRPR